MSYTEIAAADVDTDSPWKTGTIFGALHDNDEVLRSHAFQLLFDEVATTTSPTTMTLLHTESGVWIPRHAKKLKVALMMQLLTSPGLLAQCEIRFSDGTASSAPFTNTLPPNFTEVVCDFTAIPDALLGTRDVLEFYGKVFVGAGGAECTLKGSLSPLCRWYI
jgi:hypothetical protein